MDSMVSTCIITYNEEKNIRECLESVLPFSDEIVVVDSGSNDRTVEIAREYTDKIFFQPFLGHVKQKNLALSKASYPWVFAIDADERVSDVLSKEILGLKERGFGDYSGFYVRRVSFYMGRWMRRGLWARDWKIRLFRKERGWWGGKDPHDRVELKNGSKIGFLKGELLHYVYRDLSHHIETVNKYTSIISGEKDAKSRTKTILYMVFSPILTFLKGYFLKMGFLEGVPGFIQSAMGSFYAFMKYAKLYERGEKEGWGD